jgi:hypothetical protein
MSSMIMKTRFTYIAFLLLAIAFGATSCQKDSKEVYFFEEVLGCRKAAVSVVLPSDNVVTDDSLSIKLSVYKTMNKSINGSTTKVTDNRVMSIVINSLSPDQTYYYTARYTKDGVDYDSPVRSFKTMDLPSGSIDMGLSVKWASSNIGANNNDENGNNYTWEELNNDALTTTLGNDWRIPTRAEVEELIEQCSWEWGAYHLVWGQFATSTKTDNTIFFPSPLFTSLPLCYYWTSTPGDDNSAFALRTDNSGGYSLQIPCSEEAYIRPVQ